jgi:hypothetical protein
MSVSVIRTEGNTATSFMTWLDAASSEFDSFNQMNAIEVSPELLPSFKMGMFHHITVAPVPPTRVDTVQKDFHDSALRRFPGWITLRNGGELYQVFGLWDCGTCDGLLLGRAPGEAAVEAAVAHLTTAEVTTKTAELEGRSMALHVRRSPNRFFWTEGGARREVALAIFGAELCGLVRLQLDVNEDGQLEASVGRSGIIEVQ